MLLIFQVRITLTLLFFLPVCVTPLRSLSPTDPQTKASKASSRTAGVNAAAGLVVVGTQKGSLVIWRLETGEILHRLGRDGHAGDSGHATAITDAVFSPSGAKLYSASADGVIIEWDVATGRPLRTLPPIPHAASKLAVAATASGELLIAASATLTVFDLATLAPIANMAGHVSPVTALAVSADGAAFASGAADDRFVNVWRMPSAASASAAAAAAADAAAAAAAAGKKDKGAGSKKSAAAAAAAAAASLADSGSTSTVTSPTAIVAVALDAAPIALSLFTAAVTDGNAAAPTAHLAAVTALGAASLWDLSDSVGSALYGSGSASSGSGSKPQSRKAAAAAAAAAGAVAASTAGAPASTPTVSTPSTVLTVTGLSVTGEGVAAMSAFSMDHSAHAGGKPGKKTATSTVLPSLPEGALAAAQLLGGDRVVLARHSAIHPQFDVVAYTGAAAANALATAASASAAAARSDDDDAATDDEDDASVSSSGSSSGGSSLVASARAAGVDAAAVRAGAFLPAVTLRSVRSRHLAAAASAAAAAGATASVAVTATATSLKRRRTPDGEQELAVTTATANVVGPAALALASSTSALDADADADDAAARTGAGAGAETVAVKRARLAAATASLTQSLALRVRAMDSELASRAAAGRAAAAAAFAASAAGATAAGAAAGSALKGGSLAVALAQALRAQDDALLEQCLAAGAVGGARARRASGGESAAIKLTVARLPPPLVLRLVAKLVERLQQRVNRAPELLPWVRSCLRQHTAFLMSVPALGQQLAALYRVVEARAEARARLLELQGRLDLVLAQVSSAAGAEALDGADGSVTVYSEAADLQAGASAAAGSDVDDEDDDDGLGGFEGDDDDEEEEEEMDGMAMDDDE